MKRLISIFIIGIFAVLLLKVVNGEKALSPVDPAIEESPPLKNSVTNIPPTGGMLPSALYTNRLGLMVSGARDMPTTFPELPQVRKKTTADYMETYLDPEKLRKYEGSYTMDDLRGDGSAKGVPMNLQSSWLVGGSNMPQAGLRFRWDPLTRQYEMVGGEIFLPSSGIGFGRELDENSGEARTFINLKKEF